MTKSKIILKMFESINENVESPKKEFNELPTKRYNFPNTEDKFKIEVYPSYDVRHKKYELSGSDYRSLHSGQKPKELRSTIQTAIKEYAKEFGLTLIGTPKHSIYGIYVVEIEEPNHLN